MNLDDTLQRASSSEFSQYHPGPLIEAVNALVPLGKDGALAAIERSLAARDVEADPHQGLFLVLRVLFEVEAEAHPPMRLGGSMPPIPARPASLPRFPIVIVDDVPLLLVAGYELGGEAEPLAMHLDYYRKHGAVRTRPLQPGKLSRAERWGRLVQLYRAAYGRDPSGTERDFIEAQLASL